MTAHRLVRISACMTLLATTFALQAGESKPMPMPMQPAAARPDAAKQHTNAELIASALSAAPAGVAKGAEVVVMDDKDGMRTIRKGTNHFTCMPDIPSTPGPDPMCMDDSAMSWFHAYVGKTKPAAGSVGLMYMLAGGTDASNTDPYAKNPTASNHWIKTGPHLMIAGADAAFYNAYPKNADPDTSQPYVMWAGTPYQHLMVPVK